MQFTVTHASSQLPSADVIVVPVCKGDKDLQLLLGENYGHWLSGFMSSGVFAAERGTAALIPLPDGSPTRWIVLAGMGEWENLTHCSLAKSAGAAIRECARAKASSILWVADRTESVTDFNVAHALTLGSILGIYSFTQFKTQNVEHDSVESVRFLVAENADTDAFAAGIQRAEVVAEAVVFTRDLSNQPSNICNPTCVAETAQSVCSIHGMRCEVHGREWIESQGLALIAAVSRGASQEPKFVQMTYTHPDASTTIALCGKGVTFDSGGYSLKIPSDKMYGMKDDMHGAAAVIAAMQAAARTRAKVNLIGLLPLTENMIGPAAVHPGDVFRSFAGKNVEIANTDAEGRLLLADTVAYAETLEVDAIIDMATLTGACVIALGKGMSAILGTDAALVDALKAAGEGSCETLWPLPLHEDYLENIKSDVADIKNTGGMQAGTIVGALFIKSFVKKTPWAHIDLSGATIDKATPLCPVGSTGAGAGTLVEYILSFGCGD